MPESLLTILKLVFLAMLYLFFFRVLRAVWAETREGAVATVTGGRGRQAPSGRGAGTAPAASGRATQLRILAPPERKGQTFDLGDELTVGRAPGCQVSIPDDSTVSQLHARIFRQDGRLLVEDLGSTNGTFLNRKLVSGSQPLRRGDRLQVGETVLEVTR